MKRILICIAMIYLAVFVFAEQPSSQTVIQTTETADVTFVKTKLWIANYFVQNSFPVLQAAGQMPIFLMEDSGSKTIAVNGITRYESVPGQSFFDEFYNVVIFFQIKDEKVKVTIRRVFRHSPGVVDTEFLGEKFEKVIPKIIPLVDDYSRFIKSFSLDF